MLAVVNVLASGSTVLRLLLAAVDLRGLRLGAGVNSSSLSSGIFVVFAISSSSDESTTAVRRDAAARRLGRADMLYC